jgi:hypothetical protein
MDARVSKGMTGRRSIRKVIDGIFELDAGIRFVAVYQGQYLLAGGMRKGVDAYDPDDSYDVDMQLAKMGEIARVWQRWFGHLDTISLRYGRVNLLFRPLGKGRFLVMSTEPRVDAEGILSHTLSQSDFRILAETIP